MCGEIVREYHDRDWRNLSTLPHTTIENQMIFVRKEVACALQVDHLAIFGQFDVTAQTHGLIVTPFIEFHAIEPFPIRIVMADKGATDLADLGSFDDIFDGAMSPVDPGHALRIAGPDDPQVLVH